MKQGKKGEIVFLDNMEPIYQQESLRQYEQERISTAKVEREKEIDAEVIKLSDLQRSVVDRHFYQGHSIADIAVALKLKEKSVKKILEMALSNLRASLTQSEGSLANQ